jgi:hypothetical protein
MGDLGAAIAGRGGKGGGGGLGLAAALAGRGGGGGFGGGLVRKKTVGGLRLKVEKALTKAEDEIASKNSRGTLPPQMFIVCEALRAVMDVPGSGDPDDGSSSGYCARVKEVAKEWLDKLEKAQESASIEEARCQQALTSLSEEVEKWSRRKLEAPNKDAVERERENQWAIDNQAANDDALALMRSFMPTDLTRLTMEEFEERVAEAAGAEDDVFYTPALMERLKSKKLLQWVITHPDDIVRANFLMGAHKNSFEQLQEYDLIELRAVYAVIPTAFSPDADNAKRRWRMGFVQVVKDKVLSAQLQPESGERNEAYSYPTAESIEASRTKAIKLKELLEESRVKIIDVREACEVCKAEVDAAISQGRDPEAKRTIGKEVLRENTAQAKKKLSTAQRELTAFEAKLKNLEREWTRGEHSRMREEEAFQRIEANELFGKPIRPCFDPHPVLQKQENVVKKLTDEEEKALRAIELQESLKKREEAGKGTDDKTEEVRKEEVEQQKVHKKFETSLQVIPKIAKKSEETRARAQSTGLNFYQGERRSKTKPQEGSAHAKLNGAAAEKDSVSAPPTPSSSSSDGALKKSSEGVKTHFKRRTSSSYAI